MSKLLVVNYLAEQQQKRRAAELSNLIKIGHTLDLATTSVRSGHGTRMIKGQTHFFLVPKTTPQAVATAITAQAIKATSNKNHRMLRPHILFLFSSGS